MTFQNRRLIGIVLAVALLLLVPLAAGSPWSNVDFIVAGVLLLGTGLACEPVLRMVRRLEYRITICAVIVLALFLIWAEFAVGLFGTRFAGS